jgi:hypothetical protein
MTLTSDKYEIDTDGNFCFAVNREKYHAIWEHLTKKGFNPGGQYADDIDILDICVDADAQLVIKALEDFHE